MESLSITRHFFKEIIIDSRRIRMIADWAIPKHKAEVRSLDLASYYRDLQEDSLSLFI